MHHQYERVRIAACHAEALFLRGRGDRPCAGQIGRAGDDWASASVDHRGDIGPVKLDIDVKITLSAEASFEASGKREIGRTVVIRVMINNLLAELGSSQSYRSTQGHRLAVDIDHIVAPKTRSQQPLHYGKFRSNARATGKVDDLGGKREMTSVKGFACVWCSNGELMAGPRQHRKSDFRIR